MLIKCPLGANKAHWVTGFCDRSASFGLTMYKKDRKWYFKVVFEVLVDLKDIKLLEELQTFFGVGRIYQTSKMPLYVWVVLANFWLLSTTSLTTH